ncbi:hypothetical protein SPSIL_027720 [Sporomusa silvacetica DSM 10669]|uniref:Uncharacterized protein n=1 Tax=Sporomusa silvacetica DSM 10669 TaxID=1123289 RepID=A0ABZ3IMK4_9FIRM|nr:hypothetical protein SPSIL_08530 [Sporomusa silvacetica DSM 10669]
MIFFKSVFSYKSAPHKQKNRLTLTSRRTQRTPLEIKLIPLLSTPRTRRMFCNYGGIRLFIHCLLFGVKLLEPQQNQLQSHGLGVDSNLGLVICQADTVAQQNLLHSYGDTDNPTAVKFTSTSIMIITKVQRYAAIILAGEHPQSLCQQLYIVWYNDSLCIHS